MLCHFLRFSELVNLKRSDISFSDICLDFFIEKVKPIALLEGSYVLIARTNKHTCPVRTLERYLSMSTIYINSNEFIFRPLTLCSNPRNLKLRGSKPMSSLGQERFCYQF